MDLFKFREGLRSPAGTNSRLATDRHSICRSLAAAFDPDKRRASPTLSKECPLSFVISPHRDLERLTAETAAWEQQRNAARARIKLMFTTGKARAKMARAYPQPQANSGHIQRVKTSVQRYRGQHSVRINDQWRICFTWTEEGPARCSRSPPSDLSISSRLMLTASLLNDSRRSQRPKFRRRATTNTSMPNLRPWRPSCERAASCIVVRRGSTTTSAYRAP